MNYRRTYMRIISHAKQEMDLGLRPKNYNQKKKFPNQYFEFHHILPKSIFSNWAKRKSNIVALTTREHFFCHQLLTKIYSNSDKLKVALFFMSGKSKYPKKCSAKEYERLRQRICIYNSIRSKKPCSEISKEKRRKTWAAKTPDELLAIREKLKDSAKKKPLLSKTHRQRLSETNNGNFKGKSTRILLIEKYGEIEGNKAYENLLKLRSQNLHKKILCTQTNEVFSTKSEIIKKYDTNYTTLNWILNGRGNGVKTSKGYLYFKYIE